MGKNAKAGKSRKQKIARRLSEDARQVSEELERSFVRKMLPVSVSEAFILLTNIVLIVLHDEYGFGKKRLGHVVNRIMDTWECIPEYVTMDELSEEIIRMTGCRIALTAEEIDRLKEFGLQGLAAEAMFNADQREYWASRRAAGWENTTNRYGKEIIG